MNTYNKTILSFVGGCLVAGTSYASTEQNYETHKAVLSYAEFMVHPSSDEAGGITVFRKDTGNGQLQADYVYNDPRRASFNGGYADVNYSVNDMNMSTDTNLLEQSYWMRESVNVWNRQRCSSAQVSEVNHNGTEGVVERFFKTGVINADWGSDLTQVGFRSGAEMPYFANSPGVLGVAFTLTWVDADGNPTDIDNNGKSDVAFREIYYNDDWNWSDTDNVPSAHVDFPSVAIHEVGHGLSAAHFGMIAVKDGALFSKPRAIMNAIYGGKLRELTGRDAGSYCSNWAQWPNN